MKAHIPLFYSLYAQGSINKFELIENPDNEAEIIKMFEVPSFVQTSRRDFVKRFDEAGFQGKIFEKFFNDNRSRL